MFGQRSAAPLKVRPGPAAPRPPLATPLGAGIYFFSELPLKMLTSIKKL